MNKRYFIFALAFFFLSFLFLALQSAPYIFSKQADIDPQNLTGEPQLAETKAVFENREITVPPVSLADVISPVILGQSNIPKRIEVDLTNQRLYAYEGGTQVYNFLISSGKWAPTPAGTFRIWTKLRYTKMSGGSKALGTYYYLPNVPYVMYFYNDQYPRSRGFGLHGTYWHNNFGKPMSHGCVNMKTSDAALLYQWADPYLSQGQRSVQASADNPSTEIIIYGQAPRG